MKVGIIDVQVQWVLVLRRLLLRRKGMRFFLCDINEEFAANGKNRIAKTLSKESGKG